MRSSSRPHHLKITAILLGICVINLALVSAQPQTPPTVLFMCPHGAAKSVLASAYFQRLAEERGLTVRVLAAGTDPDPEVAPAVAQHLTKNGFKVPVDKPRRATAEDLAAADVVISLGCDLKDLPRPRGTVVKWDDVPAPSEDFAAADRKIRERVAALIEELMRKPIGSGGARR
jgi:arsenate reductase (thioredoxin)